MEIMDFLNVFARDHYPRYAVWLFIIAAIFTVVAARRPLSRIYIRVHKRDLAIEVRISDLFTIPGQHIISSNTTFDTDVANGVIAPNSLQGQFAERYFRGRIADLDAQITGSLQGRQYAEADKDYGKKKKYPIGTVAKVIAHDSSFYFLAMADMNRHRNAETDITKIEWALKDLWTYMASQGDLGDIVIPLLGTGRGRLDLPRKKMIERIAQSFLDASSSRIFCNKLIIAVHPTDAENFELNLFEVKDYLKHSLQI
jgi:hypothetical protein